MSAAKANASALPVDDRRRAHEPTIEEILASIRRIISDDQISRGMEVDTELEEPFGLEQKREQLHSPEREHSTEHTPPHIDEHGDITLHEAEEDRQENFLRQLKASSEAQSRGAFRQAAEILEAAERELTHMDIPAVDMRGMPGGHPVPEEIEKAPPLISDTTAAAIAAQFESLAASRLFGVDGRVDEIVCQLLQPMLQEWLEDNLPGIVEKLVRAEIERVARGGRS